MPNKTVKIIAFSDVHNDEAALIKLIPQINGVDYCFFAGDGYNLVLKHADEIKAQLFAVGGNCDFVFGAEVSKTVRIFDADFFLTHGHYFGVKTTLLKLRLAAQSAKCGLAVFGHTHAPLVLTDQGVTLINPGSLKGSDNGKKTYALISGDGISFSTEIKEL